MSISNTKRRFLISLTVITMLLGGVGGVVLQNIAPGRYFGAYPLIPAYFYLCGLLFIFAFEACRRRAPNRMVMLFMGMKMMKLILSVLLLIVYCMVAPQTAIVFLITFAVFYVSYLIYESWFFFAFERNKKLNKEMK